MTPLYTSSDSVSRMHELYKQTLLALREGRNYDAFVLMSSRSQSMTDWINNISTIDDENIQTIYLETKQLQQAIQCCLDDLQTGLVNVIQSIPARKAYAAATALGEIANHLMYHPED